MIKNCVILFSKPMEQSFCKTAFSLYFSGQITLDYCVQFYYLQEGTNKYRRIKGKKSVTAMEGKS